LYYIYYYSEGLISSGKGVTPAEIKDCEELDDILAGIGRLTIFDRQQDHQQHHQYLYPNMKRERDRVEHGDDPDVMPLSKRMNNIHFDGISGRAHIVQNNGSSVVLNGYSTEMNSTGNLNVNGNLPSTSVSSFTNVNGISGSSNPIIPPQAENQHNGLQYLPEMSRQENPIYYDQNKALFELYRERLLRNNYSPHPDFANR